MKKEVIELEAIWYGGGFHFILQEDKTGQFYLLEV